MPTEVCFLLRLRAVVLWRCIVCWLEHESEIVAQVNGNYIVVELKKLSYCVVVPSKLCAVLESDTSAVSIREVLAYLPE